MKTYTTFAAASWLLVAATGAMAAPFSADCGNTAAGQPLTREAVIADLVASRQASPTLSPRDGEWYNVPAPLGHMGRMDHMDHMGRPMARQADMGAANAMPAGSSGMGTVTRDAGAVSAGQRAGTAGCLSTSMR